MAGFSRLLPHATISSAKKTTASFATLVAELDGDLKELERIGAQNARAWKRIEPGDDDPIDWGALGFTLHRLYGVLENYFLRISKSFENSLTGERWHRDLVEKMQLDIPGVRPPLFTEERDHKNAVELMRFRFRDLHGEDLDPEKTAVVQKRARSLIAEFPGIHERFRKKVDAIAQGLP